MEICYFLIVMYFVQYIRKTLHTQENYPRWDQLLLYSRYGSIALISLYFATPYEEAVMWVWHASMLIFVGGIYYNEDFRVVRPLVVSFLPLIALGIGGDILETFFPTVYKQYDDYFDTLGLLAILWVFGTWYQNKKAQKQLAEEHLRRMEEEENRRIAEARRYELEVLVAERTQEITQQKNELETALNHLQATQAQLVQSEKMASLGELTAGIAHEIQNPLNFVNNFAEVNSELIEELREEREKSEPDQELIDELMRDLADNMQKMAYHGKRADSIVKGMLQHSRSGTGEKQKVDINALADEYMRLAYHGLRAKDKSFNAALVKDFETEVLLACVIPQDFGRVLLNIFNNAFYAVMDRKRQEDERYRPAVQLASRLCEGQVEVLIRDNGMGIPDSVRDKIFQPFFTTKPTGQGTGLGLSMSYDIVTKGHNGTLEVTSEARNFTEFLIRIPQNS